MNESSSSDSAGLWGIISLFVKWHRVLIVSFLAAGLLTYIVALFLPKWYTSRASLFPPIRESTGLGLASSLLGSGMASLLSGYSMALPALATPSDIYAEVLRSRTVAERVARKHDLGAVYKTTSLENTVNQFASHLSVKVEVSGIIRVAFEDRNPVRAAAVVQSLIEELNNVNTDINAAHASATRKFIEERLALAEKELAIAENEYRDFQEKNKAIALDDQMKAVINNLAQLRAQLVLSEIELGVLRRTLLPSHTNIKQQEARIEEIKRQIKAIEEGSPDSVRQALTIGVAQAPNLGLELARLTRNLKIQETVFELLTQQYEQAKIQEKKDTPIMQVLDPPKVPEKRSRPKRVVMAVMAGLLSVFWASCVVLAKEFIDKSKRQSTAVYRQMERLVEVLKADFYLLRSLFFLGRSKRGQRSQSQKGNVP